jgi:hypothetical protein
VLYLFENTEDWDERQGVGEVKRLYLRRSKLTHVHMIRIVHMAIRLTPQCGESLNFEIICDNHRHTNLGTAKEVFH